MKIVSKIFVTLIIVGVLAAMTIPSMVKHKNVENTSINSKDTLEDKLDKDLGL